MLVDEATKYKKSLFLEKKNEQVEPIIDWIKALKARNKIQVKLIRCDNAGEDKVLEKESDKNELGIIDTIYIKTQVFRILRCYSPAPRNIARSDRATQNITHNMTSSIIQPHGLLSL